MIIVNVYFDEDYDEETDGYDLELAGVVNECLNLNHIDLIKEAIEESEMVEKKPYTLYQVHLVKAYDYEINSFPELIYKVVDAIEYKSNDELNEWQYPLD